MKILVFSLLMAAASLPASAQSGADAPAIVQPGAPGQPTKVLPPTTRASLPPLSPKDVEFMQGMIMHHAQAVEMTAMIAERTSNADVGKIGARISQSQSDEMAFMRRWLILRRQSPEMRMSGSGHGGHGGHDMLMPGMLSPEQMKALKDSKGAEFDRLFLSGMIQHHEGALAMVDDLFKTGGAGQDGEIFNFATDVDSGQRAEIRSMRAILDKVPAQPKQTQHKQHDHE